MKQLSIFKYSFRSNDVKSLAMRACD